MTGESQVEEPRTEAGRIALASWAGLDRVDQWYLRTAVRDIEREARAAGLAAVEEAVAGLTLQTPRQCDCHRGEMRLIHEPEEARTAVLAAITALRQPQEAKDTRGEPR